MTRIPALKAVSAVAFSSLQLDVAAALSTVAADISVFLRQSSQVLKQTTLVTLQAIICSRYLACIHGVRCTAGSGAAAD